MIKIEELEDILGPDNVLNILCSIETYSCTNSDARIIDMENLDDSVDEHEYENYLETLYRDKTFSDVTFIVDEKKLKAHRCILAVASPILSSMFQKCEEGISTNVLKISDLSYEIVKEMLRFIYLKNVELLPDVAHELIAAAHRYGIQDLKMLCEESLCEKIDLENAVKFL